MFLPSSGCGPVGGAERVSGCHYSSGGSDEGLALMGDGDAARERDHCREVHIRQSLGVYILRGGRKIESVV